MEPSDSDSNPAMQRSVVVLPQPLGPSSEKNSPSITSNDNGPTVTCGEYRFVSPRTSSWTSPPATAWCPESDVHGLTAPGGAGALPAGPSLLAIIEAEHDGSRGPIERRRPSCGRACPAGRAPAPPGALPAQV